MWGYDKFFTFLDEMEKYVIKANSITDNIQLNLGEKTLTQYKILTKL